MRLLRAILLALLLASAVATAGCGSESPAERQRARLEDSLIDAANAALDDEGAYSTAVTAACDARTPASCDVGITAGTTAAYEDRFRVSVGPDGCWRAVRRGLVAADGLDAEHAPPRVLKGCVA